MAHFTNISYRNSTVPNLFSILMESKMASEQIMSPMRLPMYVMMCVGNLEPVELWTTSRSGMMSKFVMDRASTTHRTISRWWGAGSKTTHSHEWFPSYRRVLLATMPLFVRESYYFNLYVVCIMNSSEMSFMGLTNESVVLLVPNGDELFG